MSLRGYTVHELDQMRVALRWINPAPYAQQSMYGTSESWILERQTNINTQFQWSHKIEDLLRTYMLAGTTPIDLDALAESAIVAREQNAERQREEEIEWIFRREYGPRQ